LEFDRRLFAQSNQPAGQRLNRERLERPELQVQRLSKISPDSGDRGKESQQGKKWNRDAQETPDAPDALGPQVESEVEFSGGSAHGISPRAPIRADTDSTEKS
jgi:hypothetical protein